MSRRLYRVAEFAELTEVPQQTVRDQLRRGRLSGKRVRGRWRVFAKEVHKYTRGQPT
ncbi:MAG TPA: helix-turn-helix domain-containing protein [Thermoleophilia bacterium]|nr:helix-turn-helix domain-containing protein [Thermoleophilia bacterium]